MTLRKVNPGEPLRISAKAYNAFVDAARNAGSAVPATGGPVKLGAGSAHVMAKNASGIDIPRYGAVMLKGAMIDPPDVSETIPADTGFFDTLGMEATASIAEAMGFGVAATRIAKTPEGSTFTEVGRVQVSGVCAAVLMVRDADVEFDEEDKPILTPLRSAVPMDGEQYLVASVGESHLGAAQVLYIDPQGRDEEGGTIHFAILRLGPASGATRFAEVISYTPIIEQARWRYLVQPGTYSSEGGLPQTDPAFDSCWTLGPASEQIYATSSLEQHNTSGQQPGGEGADMTVAGAWTKERRPIGVGAVVPLFWTGAIWMIGEPNHIGTGCG